MNNKKTKADLYKLSNPHLNEVKSLVYSGFCEYYTEMEAKIPKRKNKKTCGVPFHREDKRNFQI